MNRRLPPSSEHDEHSDADTEVSPTTPRPGTPAVESVAEEGESVSLPRPIHFRIRSTG